jgi:GH43 family beta-xylosidase
MPRYVVRAIVVLLTLVAGFSVGASSVAGAALPSRSSEPGDSIAGPLGQRAAKAPKFNGDFADPFVLQVGSTFYAYATNTSRGNVPYGSAQIGRQARLDGDALPDLPSWSEPGHVWAPAVAPNGDAYRLYYTTRDRASGRQCISVAEADSPSGPFVDGSDAPLVCQLALGGSIDPSPIDVDGAHYLMWKNDGNCCGTPTQIWIASLTADGLGVAGRPVALLGADQPWEHGLIEGPSMIEDGGRFYLFYSANAWDSSSYATGYAVCETVTGPCHKPSASPWLSSTGSFTGPGGGSAVHTRRGLDLFVFAAWSDGKVGYDAGGSRRLVVRPLRFVEGVPVLGVLGR